MGTNKAEETPLQKLITNEQISEFIDKFFPDEKYTKDVRLKILDLLKTKPYEHETPEEFFINVNREILPSVSAAFSLGFHYRQS